jgi:hypothetical protein
MVVVVVVVVVVVWWVSYLVHEQRAFLGHPCEE